MSQDLKLSVASCFSHDVTILKMLQKIDGSTNILCPAKPSKS